MERGRRRGKAERGGALNDNHPYAPMTIPCDLRGRNGHSGRRRVLRIADYVGRGGQDANLPPVGGDGQPRGRQMLLRVLDDPPIRLVDIGPPARDIRIHRPVHDIPNGGGLEPHDIGVRERRVDPCLIAVEDLGPALLRVGADVGAELRAAAEAGAGFLDGFGKGLELRFVLDADVDFAPGGDAIEFGADVEAEFFIDRGVVVLCPDVL